MGHKIIGAASLIFAAVALSASTGAAKQAKKSRVVIMENRPLVAYEGDIAGYPATKPTRGKINPHSAHAKRYKRFLQDRQGTAARGAGLAAPDITHSYAYSLNGFAAMMTDAEVARVRAQPGVVAVLNDEMRFPTTDSSPDFLGLTGPAGAWAKGYDGEDVIVGIIDTGIWPEHPSFSDDGTYPPLPGYEDLPCEFGNDLHNPADTYFACNGKLLGARQVLPTYRAVVGAAPFEFDSARDDNGHGSHTAATAAGNADVTASVLGVERGNVSGMAPRARVIAYKGLGSLGGFSSDLAAAIDQAVADGVDVINYSIGSSSPAVGADDVAFLGAAIAGVFVATSNGNAGPGPATTGSPASVPWLTSVGASTQSRFFLGSATSSSGWDFYGASITSGTNEVPLIDAADAGSEHCIPGDLNTAMVAGNIVLCKRGAVARVAKSEAVYLAGGAGMILYNANDDQATLTDTHWVPSVHINNTDGLAIKAYISSAAATAVAQINGGEKVVVDAPSMAAFSSRGPNRLSGDIIKPDITAPGVQILAAMSPVTDGGVQGELFGAIAGTSMSSPHIAGIFALVKQAHPEWSAAVAKSALMTTAYRQVSKEDGVTPADPFDMGAGHVDMGDKANKGSVFEPGLAYDAGLFEYAAFTCGLDLNIFTPGSCAFLEAIGVPTDPSNLNLPSIGIDGLTGSETVQRTVISVAREEGWRVYRPTIVAPAGFDVGVEPTMLALRGGESATFRVTITRISAPTDQWVHGSLTWNDDTGHYEVYTPISVNAALLRAAEEVRGHGESGSTSFSVVFGYSGPYAATAHGLLPATLTSDNVVQDPDQNFSPADGYSTVHSFAVSSAGILRFALPPEATEDDADLDIYLFDPAGNLAGWSYNAGTDEQVEIREPADGLWTLFVHGWASPGGDSDYDLYSWIVPAVPGGNLTIDAAPTTAILGTTGNIDLSWAGASSGGWHLGAVSHSGEGGLMGWTLVEVDNR